MEAGEQDTTTELIAGIPAPPLLLVEPDPHPDASRAIERAKMAGRSCSVVDILLTTGENIVVDYLAQF
jgi:hypothetical protein